MKFSGERIFNVFLGCSFIFWAIAGWFVAENPSIIRLSISLLNLTLGLLILFRVQAKRLGNPVDILKSLPSLILGGMMFRFSAAPSDWSMVSIIIFMIGMMITLASFITLGRSFSILPQVRPIVTKGPYRLVRHPGYLGELLLMIGCVIASESLLVSGICFALFWPFLAWRILVEETLLSQEVFYLAYLDQVKWRILPGVW